MASRYQLGILTTKFLITIDSRIEPVDLGEDVSEQRKVRCFIGEASDRDKPRRQPSSGFRYCPGLQGNVVPVAAIEGIAEERLLQEVDVIFELFDRHLIG